MSAFPDTPVLKSLSSSLATLVAHAAASVVSLHSGRARSSGFIWRPGLVVAPEGALADDGEVSLTTNDGATAPARLLGRDPSTDVALFKVGREDLAQAAAAPSPPAAGALAIVVGRGEGGPTAALGIVAYSGPAWRSLRGGLIDARIELDASLRRSSEGGLAFDADGGAFGMAVFGPRRRTLVIPFATIDRAADRLLAHGKVSRGYLGLGLQPVRAAGGGVGAMAMSVDADGPAASAGIRQGDVIVAWNGEAVRGVHQLLRALGPDSVGSIVKLSLTRGGDPLEVALTVGERPPSA
jgi:S1-C subfamily serine protease